MKRLLILLAIGVLLYAGLKDWAYRTLVTQGPAIDAAAPDYRLASAWAALPDQPAPAVWSDGWAADVFYLPPPSSAAHKSGDVAVDDVSAQRSIGKTLEQLSPALSQGGSIYAPYYRHGSSAERAPQVDGQAISDQYLAFETYLTEYNRGRALFLAVHDVPNAQIMERITTDPRLIERFGGVIRISDKSDTSIKPLTPPVMCSGALEGAMCEQVLAVKRKTVPLGVIMPRLPVKRHSFALKGEETGGGLAASNKTLLRWLTANAAKTAEPLGGFEDVEIAPIREPGQIDDTPDEAGAN